MRKTLVFVASILALSLASSCATLENNPASAKLVTQYAVLKFAEQSSADKRAERIANVQRVATDVKAIAAGEPVSIGLLKAAVGAEIAKLNLSPADTMLANALVDMLAIELSERVGEGILDPDQLVQVAKVMDWIIEAAALASPPAPS